MAEIAAGLVICWVLSECCRLFCCVFWVLRSWSKLMKSFLEFYVVKLVPISEYLADVLLLFEAEMAGSQVYIFCICLI